ncbi:MAG: hypothetical protein GY759_10625 [Chloroflexi bacterium]|nr:hypothetical protein [Chloroflexota bacterium]
MRTFSGAWPALITPFTDNDQVNEQVLQRMVEYLIEKGVGGFYLCGRTGEGPSMSLLERKRVAETVVAQVKGRLPVIIQVGTSVVPDAVELARHAQTIGADGVSSLIPERFSSSQSIYDYYSIVANAAPDLPFFPYIFGSEIDAEALMTSLLAIPNVAGTKYTSPNMYELQFIASMRDSDWTVFSGMDEQCMFAAMWGSKANIGSTLNLMSGAYKEIHRLVQSGDVAAAQTIQLRANQVTRTLFSFGFMGALKASLGLLGYECGQPRLPQLALPRDKHEALSDALNDVRFRELADM